MKFQHFIRSQKRRADTKVTCPERPMVQLYCGSKMDKEHLRPINFAIAGLTIGTAGGYILWASYIAAMFGVKGR
jgi:hypothetical protein